MPCAVDFALWWLVGCPSGAPGCRVVKLVCCLEVAHTTGAAHRPVLSSGAVDKLGKLKLVCLEASST